MALTDKLRDITKNPKAQQLIDNAKAAAQKPENREKLQQLTNRFKRRSN